MLVSVFLSCLLWLSAVSALPRPKDEADQQGPSCNCTGTRNGGQTANRFICRDSRLGPRVLPRKLPLGSLLSSYNRLGGLTPGEFLTKWTDEQGNYKYPPQNGFQLDSEGNAINGTMILEPGTLVDRFGSEYGSYVSAATAPYSQRALPPSNLDTNPDAPEYPNNYHVYEVLKPLPVVGGPIAPWFGQPGLGAQFFTGGIGNIMALIEQGYLEREDPEVLISRQKGCA